MTKKIIVKLVGDGTEGNPFRPDLPPGTDFVDITNRDGKDCDTGDGIVVEVNNDSLTDDASIVASIPQNVKDGGIEAIKDHLKHKPKKPKTKNEMVPGWESTLLSQLLE